MGDIDKVLAQEALAFVRRTAIAAVGDIVETTRASCKRPQTVRITHVGAHLVCRYSDTLGDWVAGFAMDYYGERLRKDGTSKEQNKGGAIVLRNLRTLGGNTWAIGGRWNEEFGFNHAGLHWGTNRDTRAAAEIGKAIAPGAEK
ncbi:MAG: hypothetical protein V4730_12015 [Pseudomonadota bacterium]